MGCQCFNVYIEYIICTYMCVCIYIFFRGISDCLSLLHEWEGISDSVQRPVLVRGRENPGNLGSLGTRGWDERVHTKSEKSKTSSTQSHIWLGMGPWTETVFQFSS